MSIQVQQTLHGYGNGHQLLAGSINLDAIDSKLLLFQSDLSGPTLVNGFDTYISGYPLKSSSYFAFSRTWYAQEMSRPGCVWTHTLLIEFSDLGKLVSFDFLNDLFKRPAILKYSEYSRTIELHDISNYKKPLTDGNKYIKNQIASLLYEEYNSTTIVPATRAVDFESIVLDIWSDQWPRLRRNFMFCTGALSLRSIDSRPYDLQVIPNKLLEQIRKQPIDMAVQSADTSINPIIETSQQWEGDWTTDLLWIVGSDIEGTRKNFLSLLKLMSFLSTTTSVADISKVIMSIFPNANEALVFKSKLFGKNSSLPFKFNEHEVLTFLLTSPDKSLSFLNLNDLELEPRLVELLASERITVLEFANLYNSAKAGRLSDDIWNSVEIDASTSLKLCHNYPELSQVLLDKNPRIATHVEFWHIPIKQQLKALKKLDRDHNIRDWFPFLNAILRSKSEIFNQTLNIIGVKYLPVILECFSEFEESDPIELQSIINEYYSDFKTWLQTRKKNIHWKIFEAVFIGLDFHKIQKLDLISEEWIHGYDVVSSRSNRVNHIFTSCILLSIGFQNRINHSDKLVVRTFEAVYKYGKKSQLNSGIWQMINRDDYYDDDNESIGFWSIFTKRKRDRVPYWDYCESLIRIAANAFAKNQWSTQSFISSFVNPEIFERIVDYSQTFDKGEKYIKWVYRDILNGKISAAKTQTDILKSVNGK